MAEKASSTPNVIDVVELVENQQKGMPAVDHQLVVEEGRPGSSVVAVLKGAPFTARVRRPIHRKHEKGDLEEVVRVTMTVGRQQFYHMNLFINKPTASEATPIASCPEFASAFNHLSQPPLSAPPSSSASAADDESSSSPVDDGGTDTTLFCVGIGDIVSQLGLSLHTHLLLTFVPTGLFKDAPLTINHITIDLE